MNPKMSFWHRSNPTLNLLELEHSKYSLATSNLACRFFQLLNLLFESLNINKRQTFHINFKEEN